MKLHAVAHPEIRQRQPRSFTVPRTHERAKGPQYKKKKNDRMDFSGLIPPSTPARREKTKNDRCWPSNPPALLHKNRPVDHFDGNSEGATGAMSASLQIKSMEQRLFCCDWRENFLEEVSRRNLLKTRLYFLPRRRNKEAPNNSSSLR